jgi:REG-2-like HAD superfamily hydrolase
MLSPALQRLRGSCGRASSYRARLCACSASSSATAPRPTHRAVLVDVGGCLLEPAEPVPDTYVRFATAHGVRGLTPAAVKAGFRAAFAAPRAPGVLRYEGDGAAFWRPVVAAATGCADAALFDALFAHYGRPEAWRVAPGAPAALRRLRAAGVRLAVVSNWDTRLRPLLEDLQLAPLFDAIIVSAELRAEKPDARVFAEALQALGGDLQPREALMVGDDEGNDVAGATAHGCDAMLFGRDVATFEELAETVLRAVPSA